SYLNFGGSPLSEEIHTITGVDSLRIKLWGIKTSKEFTGNVIIFPASKRQPSSYINGIPFYSVATMNSRSTDFLDSLGLKNNNHSQNIVMPLETMFRFTIDNNIDNVELI
ncbi:TPA: ABC transporter permease, partial [Escherichia coli]